MTQTFTVVISDRDVEALHNDLFDINAWIQDAVAGKVAQSRKRLAHKGLQTLKGDPNVQSIPANDAEIIDAITARPDYLNRKQREAAIAAARAAAGEAGREPVNDGA